MTAITGTTDRMFYLAYAHDSGHDSIAINSDARHITPSVLGDWVDLIQSNRDQSGVVILFFTQIAKEDTP